jgi:hypothetical protein
MEVEQIMACLLVIQEKMEAYNEEKKAILQEKKSWREETMACLESKKPTSVEIRSEVEHEEVPKEEATVETFGALKEQYGDRL